MGLVCAIGCGSVSGLRLSTPLPVPRARNHGMPRERRASLDGEKSCHAVAIASTDKEGDDVLTSVVPKAVTDMVLGYPPPSSLDTFFGGRSKTTMRDTDHEALRVFCVAEPTCFCLFTLLI
ncbi:hypothetical protein NW754_001595 [Fusarium falciforme]|nr:hypothetical protein NW754_001595 [Fusarium falciforme]